MFSGKRKIIEKTLLDGMSKVLRPEEYKNFSEMLTNMPDTEFDAMCAEVIAQPNKVKFDSMFDAIEKTLEAKKLDVADTEYYSRNLETKDLDTVGKEIYEIITKSIAPDTIHLTSNQDGVLQEIWRKIGRKTNFNKITIPSDIFFANTIPLKDCEIEVDESDITYENGTNGVKCRYRIVVLEDFEDRIRKAEQNEIIEVGYIAMFAGNISNEFMGTRIYIQKGVDSIIMGALFATSKIKNGMDFDDDMKFYLIQNTLGSCMGTWYSVQVSLLNPRTQTVYLNPAKVKNENYRKAKTEEERKRVAKYVKHYYLKDDEVETAIYGDSKHRGIERKCLVWYVIGHWRTYKNGKIIFVQPYWKGELRDIKRNLDERERLL